MNKNNSFWVIGISISRNLINSHDNIILTLDFGRYSYHFVLWNPPLSPAEKFYISNKPVPNNRTEHTPK